MKTANMATRLRELCAEGVNNQVSNTRYAKAYWQSKQASAHARTHARKGNKEASRQKVVVPATGAVKTPVLSSKTFPLSKRPAVPEVLHRAVSSAMRLKGMLVSVAKSAAKPNLQANTGQY